MSNTDAGPVSSHPVRLLTYSTLFPHAGLPNHGVFVENRLRHLLETGAAVSTVVAPVPWFPARAARFGSWSRYARADRNEVRGGLHIHHPRFPLIPRLGMSVAPLGLFAGSLGTVRRLMRDGLRFDVIDAHYLYPDGVAAVMLGRQLGKPVVITARGSDVTQLPDHSIPRRWIQWAMAQAAALISVSAGLKAGMVALGAPPEKVTVLRNGVDLQCFQPRDRDSCRRALGLDGPTLLSVGLLTERKGHHRTIEAMTALPGWRLLIVGEGRQRAELQALISAYGVGDRVTLLGAHPHSELPSIYSAADALVLSSSREGWANVLLEAMACGTPVVASNIPGNPEVVREPAAGVVTADNTPAGIAAGVRALDQMRRPRAETRAYAERFSWDDTSAGQIAVFRRVMQMAQGGSAPPVSDVPVPKVAVPDAAARAVIS